MSIIDTIKSIFERFKNRNVPQLEERNPRPHNRSGQAREDFVRKTREGVTPQKSYHRESYTTQSAPLVQVNRQNRSRNSHRTRYTGNRRDLRLVQEQQQPSHIKAKIASIILAGALVVSGGHVLYNHINGPDYNKMTLEQISECLDSNNYNPEKFSEISNAVYEKGKLEIKEAFANATGMSDRADDFTILAAENIGNEYSPTQVITPSGNYYGEDDISFSEQYNTFSSGLAAVINSTGKAQTGLSTEELETYIKQLEVLDEAEVSVSDTSYYRHRISTDREKELIDLSVAENLHINDNSKEESNDFEIGD